MCTYTHAYVHVHVYKSAARVGVITRLAEMGTATQVVMLCCLVKCAYFKGIIST